MIFSVTEMFIKMVNLYLIVAFILIITAQACRGMTYNFHRRVDQLKSKNRYLYGKETVIEIKTGNYVNGENYPRGDKQKLALISRQWCNYYDCLARLKGSLTAAHQLPSTMVMVYAGGVARLRCNLCVAPDERPVLTWTFAQSTNNLTFLTMEDKDRTVWDKDLNLAIYHAAAEDAGVYRCQVGRSVGGLVVLDVVDNENYTVVSTFGIKSSFMGIEGEERRKEFVKPSSTRGPYASPSITLNNTLTVFSSWSQWSECSVCGKVGRRRRTGLCYVKLYLPSLTNSTTINGLIENEYDKNILDDATLNLFDVFPSGIPCRSRHLPRAIRRIPAVLRRPSEIMIALCKVKCKDTIFELRSNGGQVLERANNTAGVYSLSQTLSKQPPLPARDTIFVACGQPFVIRCPGTTLRDVPVTWRIGTRRAVPRQLDEASAGRVHLDARDRLVFTRVLYGDADLYSCWQRDALAGTVKLSVWGGACTHWNQHVTLALLVALAAVALHVAERVLRDKRHRRT